MIEFVIYGQLYSMKNSKIPSRTRPGLMIKHPKARQFEEDFLAQVPKEAKLGYGSKRQLLHAIVDVYYPSRRQDLETALVYDLLQRAGVVSNDRHIVKHTETAYVDPERPRVHIRIEVL